MTNLADLPANAAVPGDAVALDLLAARRVLLHGGRTLGVGFAPNTYLLNGNPWGGHVFRWDPANFAIAGRTTRMAIRGFCHTGTLQSGVTFAFGLHPITGSSGASGVLPAPIVGATVLPTASFTAPTPVAQQTSLIFDAPAVAGFYALCVVTSGGNVVGTAVEAGAQLHLGYA